MKNHRNKLFEIKLKVYLAITGVISLANFHVNAQSYEVLYSKQVNNNDNIWVVNQDGRRKQITNHSRKDSSPVISPDGDFMIFASERVGWWKIWLLDIQKNEFKQLTNSNRAEYSPSWSPDGSQIVFVSSHNGNSNIYTMDKAGLNMKNITGNSQSNAMPFWAKDNFIYYSLKVGETYQIMKMLPDGSNKETVSTGKGDKLMPQLSNDCKTILYYGNVSGNNEIYTMDLKTSKTVRLTTHDLMNIRPRWSPDDKKIVFERGNKKGNQHIYIMDANGQNVKQLTFENYNYAPSFVLNNIELVKN